MPFFNLAAIYDNTMATRTTRNFNENDKRELLKQLQEWRYICVQVCTKAPIGGDAYRMADKLITGIDEAAKTLTGDRKYFHVPPHSAGSKA